MKTANNDSCADWGLDGDIKWGMIYYKKLVRERVEISKEGKLTVGHRRINEDVTK
jgi:hypothetical protein